MEPSNGQKQELRKILKSELKEYLQIDNEISLLNKKVNLLKQQRSKHECNLQELGEVLSLEGTNLKTTSETITFCYIIPKPTLSNSLIKNTLNQYLNIDDSWRSLPVNTLIDTLIIKFNEYKEHIAMNKKKNLKIKRQINKS